LKKISINIAGYNIRFESADNGPDLLPAGKFLNYKGDEAAKADLLITIHSGNYSMPEGTEMIFRAPYFEENEGIPVKKNDRFWSILRCRDEYFIEILYPFSPVMKKSILLFSPAAEKWELWTENGGESLDPMEYPADGLILYYLTVRKGDIMLHASGISYSGKGYIFSGISGTGKSTMAKLWSESGAKVIHDDRLILRNESGRYIMHNTPVYDNDTPLSSPVDEIFLIGHGQKNEIVPLSGASCVAMFIANCIQHNWSREIVSGLLESALMLCNKIPVTRLFFKPDRNIIDFILNE
jgi:hypothetical protein